jgi:hypothetical protein
MLSGQKMRGSFGNISVKSAETKHFEEMKRK